MAEKRNIFEDVAADGPQANIPKTSLIDGDKNRSRRRIRIWLHVLLA